VREEVPTEVFVEHLVVVGEKGVPIVAQVELGVHSASMNFVDAD